MNYQKRDPFGSKKTMEQKMKKTIVILSLFLFPGEAFAEESKLDRIDRDIARLEKQKNGGLTKLGLGLALEVAGYVLFMPSYDIDYSTYETTSTGNAGLFSAVVLSGAVLTVWGGWEYWGASQELATLKAKRYDLSLAPTYDFTRESYGIALNGSF